MPSLPWRWRDRAARLAQEDRYWDAVGRGAPPDVAIDPDVATAIARAHALDDAPAPDPAFVARLEGDLLQAGLRSRQWPAALGSPRPMLATGHVGPRWRPPAPVAGRDAWAPLAAAAVLLLTLSLGLRAVGGRWFSGLEVQRVVAPALLATPAVTPAAAPLALRGSLQARPTGPTWTGIARNTLAPGATLTYTTSSSALLLIEAGPLELRADGPVAVEAPGRRRWLAPAGTTLTLATGDGAVVLPGDVPIQWRNPGSAPAVVIAAEVQAADALPTVPGLVRTALAAQADAPLPAPATVELQRVTLAPNATLPPPATGQARLAAAATAGSQLRRASDGSYANETAQPVVAYVLTIAPSTNGAAPAATPTP